MKESYVVAMGGGGYIGTSRYMDTYYLPTMNSFVAETEIGLAVAMR